jgi:hypothetical protein
MDGDGVDNQADLCPRAWNGGVLRWFDRDGDGVGDFCDNCPHQRNPTQWDSDHDGTGDACEPRRFSFFFLFRLSRSFRLFLPNLPSR